MDEWLKHKKHLESKTLFLGWKVLHKIHSLPNKHIRDLLILLGGKQLMTKIDQQKDKNVQHELKSSLGKMEEAGVVNWWRNRNRAMNPCPCLLSCDWIWSI